MATRERTDRDQAAERAVVGALILRPEFVEDIPGGLGEEDFTVPGLGRFACHLIRAIERGEAIDFVALEALARSTETLALLGGAEGLAKLGEAYGVHRAAFVRHCRTLEVLGHVRALGQACAELGEDARLDREPSTFVERAATRLGPLTERSSVARPRRVGELSGEVLTELMDGKQRGIATGLHGFDRITTGLGRGNLVVIGGRPSMGKSVLGVEMAIGTGVPALIFQLEMRDRQLVTRMLCRAAQVDMTRARHGKLGENEKADLVRGEGLISRLPVWISDKPGQSIATIRATSRRFAREHRHKNLADELTDVVIMIDYLQLVDSSGDRDSREQEVAEISRGSKLLALELNVPVLLLCQLNREVDKRSEPRPQLSDLRESGAIEQDADDVVFIWRPERYQQTDKPEHRGLAEVIVAKQRMGATSAFWVHFDGKFAAIRNREGDQ